MRALSSPEILQAGAVKGLTNTPIVQLVGRPAEKPDVILLCGFCVQYT